MWAPAAVLLVVQAASASVPTEVINLDLPPEERWRDFAIKYRRDIIGAASSRGRTYEEGIGKEGMARWIKAAPVTDELLAEYRGIVKHVNDPDVTLERLIIQDMWHAVQAPTFGECTGLLAATRNGTVIHGRNVDYDIATVAGDTATYPPRYPDGGWYDGVLARGGKPIASFVSRTSSGLGIHTGMRLKDGPNTGWSINTNARVHPNNITLNLLATEAGSKNFPWLIRHFLQSIPDYDTLLQSVQSMNVNAPNYFILAGSGPYQGAVFTKDRGGQQLPSTPPPRFLSASSGAWFLLQTNDDVNKEPLDRRRDMAVTRLSALTQDQVSDNWVLNEMRTFPVQNSDTLLTWVANPAASTHGTYPRDERELGFNVANRLLHQQLHLPMPWQLPSAVALLESARAPSPPAPPAPARRRLRARPGTRPGRASAALDLLA